MSSPAAIDPRIQRLKLTTFFGKRLTRRQIADVQEMAASLPGLSRNELGKTVCEHLGWKTKRGRSRVRLAVRVLEELERLGVLSLPEKRRRRRGGDKPVTVTARSAPRPLIDTDLDSLRPLQLQLAQGEQAVAEWQEWVQRYRPRGCRKPLGAHLRYVLRDRQGRLLGCAQCEYASCKLACRDEWIGWQGEAFHRHLKLVVRHSRYLLLPWVRVPCLASKALGPAVRQSPDDWQRRHGSRPALVETLVDPEPHKATCYRAANWQLLGLTKGRKAREKAPAKTPNKRGRICNAQVPERQHFGIVWDGGQLAIVAETPNPGAAKEFLAHRSSPRSTACAIATACPPRRLGSSQAPSAGTTASGNSRSGAANGILLADGDIRCP